jgi:hypothetical protein
MNSKIFQIPAEMTKAMTMRNDAVRLQFDSQENVSSEELRRVFDWRGKVGWLLFAVHLHQPEDLLSLPKIQAAEPDEKSPAQKLRAALYVLYKQQPDNFTSDEEHYRFYMEKFRQHVLAKLPKD